MDSLISNTVANKAEAFLGLYISPGRECSKVVGIIGVGWQQEPPYSAFHKWAHDHFAVCTGAHAAVLALQTLGVEA